MPFCAQPVSKPLDWKDPLSVPRSSCSVSLLQAISKRPFATVCGLPTIAERPVPHTRRTTMGRSTANNNQLASANRPCQTMRVTAVGRRVLPGHVVSGFLVPIRASVSVCRETSPEPLPVSGNLAAMMTLRRWTAAFGHNDLDATIDAMTRRNAFEKSLAKHRLRRSEDLNGEARADVRAYRSTPPLENQIPNPVPQLQPADLELCHRPISRFGRIVLGCVHE